MGAILFDPYRMRVCKSGCKNYAPYCMCLFSCPFESGLGFLRAGVITVTLQGTNHISHPVNGTFGSMIFRPFPKGRDMDGWSVPKEGSLLNGKWHVFFPMFSSWWFQTFFIFTPTWGRFHFWLIFFNWVETTNQTCFSLCFLLRLKSLPLSFRQYPSLRSLCPSLRCCQMSRMHGVPKGFFKSSGFGGWSIHRCLGWSFLKRYLILLLRKMEVYARWLHSIEQNLRT